MSPLMAEFAKAALLSGPAGADDWLRYGGIVLLVDSSTRVVRVG